MGMSQVIKLVAVAFLTAVGLGLFIVGCAAYKNWLPMISLIPYIFTLAPLMICGIYKKEDDFLSDSPQETWLQLISQFIVGLFGGSAVALIAVMMHAKMIDAVVAAFVFPSFFLMSIAVFLLMWVLRKSAEDAAF
eukprot:TRINITY_DN103930_c0_g1_i1.p1 TRINITY_DN103930_c0_g1~~TRINITY_DN103930_c0_g1_i1.p1  ORF type:complete len:152 (+),score=19.45 TRINITY_DN103930_c0_g1_i1:54-458(+)